MAASPALSRGLEILRRVRARAAEITFPSERYRARPVEFAREILGIEPWERQREVLEAVRDHLRVAVSSGHKTGKSTAAAILALWYFCSHSEARVVMSSKTARQVDQILWREVKMLRSRAGRCLECRRAAPDGPRPCPHSAVIDGEIGELARTGLRTHDFREIVGFTAREAEAVAGISGANLLYVVDEASGVPPAIFEAIEGNRAGGARIVLLSNPTRTDGEFFDAFHAKADFYRTLTINSETTPNAATGTHAIPGLATREWIDEKRAEWGEDSSLYSIRVKGEFALHEDGKIFSVAKIAEAEARWHETKEAGRLFVGVDPAGPSGSGDETVYAVRRGLKHMALYAFRGLSEDGHVVHLRALLDTHKLPRETPVVVVDREGSIGSALAGRLRAIAEERQAPFELVTVRASDRAQRQPHVYDRMRDELAANLEAWFRDGGAIVEDARLAEELHELEWEHAPTGRLKLTRKVVLRKELGRSPDRYDALALAVWEPLSLHVEDLVPSARRVVDDAYESQPAGIDPYAGSDPWG